MKDPRWHVRLVTSAAITDHLIDCHLPSDAVEAVFDAIPLDDDFVSVTVTENPVYRKYEDQRMARDLIEQWKELAEKPLTHAEQLAEAQLRG